jgi:hypothetical protein
LLLGINDFFVFDALLRCGFLFRSLLVRVQEALGNASRSICPAADPGTQNMTPSVLAAGKALNLAICVRVVVVETSTRITIPSGMVCDDAKRRRGRFCDGQ